jgi:drug/metabolite transporter (DMT)-like permease
MLFIWCILVTTCIGVCFKLFATFNINTFNAIVINYTVCLTLGTIINPTGSWPFSISVIQSPWFKFDIILGFLFITGFNLTAYAIRKVGITMTTLMQRMSIILTVSFTVILFHEHFGLLELAGLIIALLAIIAINQKGPPNPSFKKTGGSSAILLIVLAISATIEILLFYVEKTGLVGGDQLAFTTHGFGTAAVIGWVAILWRLIKRKPGISKRDIYAGLILGLPNFFSIYLLLMMLNRGWKGSLMYPMVNVSVLLLSTLVAVLLFKEKLNRLNWIGITLASISILIIAYAHNAGHWKINF